VNHYQHTRRTPIKAALEDELEDEPEPEPTTPKRSRDKKRGGIKTFQVV